MSANSHANGGLRLRDLVLPDFRDYAVKVQSAGTEVAEATRILGKFLRDVMKLNENSKNFRIFGPDETESNRLGALFEVTDKVFMQPTLPVEDRKSTRLNSSHRCISYA